MSAIARYLPVSSATLREYGPGAAASLLLHLLALLIILFVFMKAAQQPQVPLRVVPIDLVMRLGDTTTAPSTVQKSPIPVSPAPRTRRQEEANPTPYEGVSPNGRKPVPIDNLDAKLRALARMKMPERTLPALDNAGVSDTAAGEGAPGDAAYSLRDFVRATVERRWNLDFGKLGKRKWNIAISVAMKRDGTIEKAEIVDRTRYMNDAVFRSVALSARNAVLLSSPIPLPPGTYDDVMRFTLDMNPRDMAR
jgi:hypothetical protein